MGEIFTLGIRSQSHVNVVEAGVVVCLRRAESGRRPTSLLAGLPRDPFSGEGFEYKRTDEGFVLRCRVKELGGDDKANEYVFAVK
jgi:hypothetical protein